MGPQSAIVTRGFDAFSRGTMSNGGQNLYVSRAGVLQRIFQFDVDQDGYLDLIFCNSQSHWEQAPAYVYPTPLTDADKRITLPANGARSGAVADLTGDGCDDLVVGNFYNGVTYQVNASIYFGAPDGISERYRQELPAPICETVAAGDFNGDGKIDLAFQIRDALTDTQRKVRLFYQGDLGFEPKRYVDLTIDAQQMDADDLDGDGYAELIVRRPNGEVRVYWGGPDGIDADTFTIVPVPLDPERAADQGVHTTSAEYVEQATPLVRTIRLDQVTYIFVAREDAAYLVPMQPGGREFGQPLVFACGASMAVATGDLDGNGMTDLVFACQSDAEQACSWVYWAGDDGFSEQSRTGLPSRMACDVVVGDLDGDGRDEIVLCQAQLPDCFTSTSVIYHGVLPDQPVPQPHSVVSQDARRVFLLRTLSCPLPQLAVINHFSGNAWGDVDVYIYKGGPDGFDPERRQSVPGWGAVDAIFADLNDNGWADLILCNCAENSPSQDPGSFVYYNTPQGFPERPSCTLPSQHGHGMICGDLNRNGYLDLVFGGWQQEELLIFHGTADGFDTANPERLRLEYDGKIYNETRWLFAADLNNNGWLDIVVPQIAYDRSFILWGGPEGYSMARAQALSVFHAATATAADLNGNGYLDLVIGGHIPSGGVPQDAFVYIYWNGPDGYSESRRTLLPARGTNGMVLADFNNNGLLDIFVCSYHDVSARDIDSYIYWNREGRGFSAEDRNRMFTHSASGCVAADFNDNGWTDLAIAYHKVEGDHVGWSAVWWNGPEGFDESRMTTLPTMGPHAMTRIEPGNIMDRGPEETYVSEPFELPDGTVLESISWQADVPPRTWVNAQLRTADTAAALDETPWTGPDGPDSRYANDQRIPAAQTKGRWLQYRLALGADKSLRTPRVEEVTVRYR